MPTMHLLKTVNVVVPPTPKKKSKFLNVELSVNMNLFNNPRPKVYYTIYYNSPTRLKMYIQYTLDPI